MQIGDPYTFTPSAFSDELRETPDGRRKQGMEIKGRVIYIHPERRYFTVEAVVYGRTIRESFHLRKRN